jgi:mannose-1-phosphate guanylyltransferase
VEVHHLLRVPNFVEKPTLEQVTTNLIHAGVYVLERQIVEMIPEGREVSTERDIFSEAAGYEQAERLRFESLLP